MAREPLDNISTPATLEGQSPQSGQETLASERAIAREPMPMAHIKGQKTLSDAMRHLARDHGHKR